VPRHLRLPTASLTGTVSRLTRGDLRDLDRAAKLDIIRQVTTEPLALGTVLGELIAPEHPEYAAADAEGAGLLRELGPDEDQAERVAEWLRWSRERRARAGGFRL